MILVVEAIGRPSLRRSLPARYSPVLRSVSAHARAATRGSATSLGGPSWARAAPPDSRGGRAARGRARRRRRTRRERALHVRTSEGCARERRGYGTDRPTTRGIATLYNRPVVCSRPCPKVLVRRLALVVVVVLALAAVYRSFGSAETGTGNLTLPPPEPNENRTRGTSRPSTWKGTRSSSPTRASTSSPSGAPSTRTPTRHSRASRSWRGSTATRRRLLRRRLRQQRAQEDGDAPYDRFFSPRRGGSTSLYNVKRVPRLFVIDEGKIAFPLDGYYDGYQNDLEEELDAALEEDRNRTG